jgi:hypothetical protein
VTEPQQGILQHGTLSSQHTGTEGMQIGKALLLLITWYASSPPYPPPPTYVWQQQSTGTGDVADPNISQQQITELVSDKRCLRLSQDVNVTPFSTVRSNLSGP